MLMLITTLFVASMFVGTPDVDRKPNVILIMADDLGVAELGCTGGTRIRTPNIDALRESGMLFTDAYSGSTVCAPSRCTLLTGLHTGHSQIRDNGEMPNFTGPPDDPATEQIGGWEVPPEPSGLWGGQRGLAVDTETVARALKRAGYATCGVGKWGLGGPSSIGHPNNQGFDHWFGYLCQRNAHNYYPTYLMRNDERVRLEGNDRDLTGEQYATDLMTDEALTFIRANEKDPFFLYYATPVPHLALQVPQDSLAEYQGKWDDPPYEGGKGYLPHPEPRAAYAAMVTRFDRDVGRMVELVRDLGIEDETIFILTSDNGSTFNLGGYDPEFFQGTGGLRGFKTNLYEGGIRVPLIASWPGHIAADSASDVTTANWDIFPTILGLTGVKTSAELDGIDLAPVLLGTGSAEDREALYWEFHTRGGIQAVRMGSWKAVRPNAHGNPDGPIELYDLAADPNETTNVADQHPEVVARLETIMRESRTVSPVPGWNFAPEEREVPKATEGSLSSIPVRTWTGGGDGFSFADAANWTGEGAISLMELTDNFIIADPKASVGGRAGCPLLECSGGLIQVRAGRITGNGRGFRNGTMFISGGEVDRLFVLNSEVTVSGSGVLRLHGGAVPVNRSTIMIVGPDARIEFTNEDPESVRKEHLRKFKFENKKVVEGRNLKLESNGRGGTIVSGIGSAAK